MLALARLFWNVCLLRTGPEHMPAAGFFLLVVLAANLLISTLTALSAPAGPALLQALSLPVVAAAVLALGTWFALQLKALAHRFMQTLAALLGADTVMTALSWPLLAMASPDLAGSGLEWVLILGQLALVFWWVTVAGFIFARALEVGQAQGVGVAVLVILASLIVTASVVPLPAADP